MCQLIQLSSELKTLKILSKKDDHQTISYSDATQAN